MQSATGFLDIALMVLGFNHDKIDALANEFKERAITAGTAKMNFLRGVPYGLHNRTRHPIFAQQA